MTDSAGLDQRRPQVLFPIIVENYHVPNREDLHPRLLAEIDVIRSAEAGEKRSNRGGWHSSPDLFRRTEPALSELTQFIRQALELSVRRYVPEFVIAKCPTRLEGWINVNGKGAYNAPHLHGTYHLSGVYYVAVPETGDEVSGMLELFSPSTSAGPGKLGKLIAPDKVALKPVPGSLIIFPSHLRHWVYPNQETQERVSIAFNAAFEIR